MADAKIDVKIGAISFVGEGSETWLATQLKVILDAAATLAVSLESNETLDEPQWKQGAGAAGAKGVQTLPAYLKAKNATTGPAKFLATADWLRLRGTTSLSTGEVTKALRVNHQGRLGNPSEALAKNINKGFCEKDGKGFYITSEGLTHLGHPAA